MGIKLVIADDAPFIRELIRRVLSEPDFDVVAEASTGTMAIEKALELKPDLILMDIVMPEKSGIEATKEIMEKLPETKILALSTLDQQTLIQKAIAAGCKEFVVKPFTAQQLLTKIQGILN